VRYKTAHGSRCLLPIPALFPFLICFSLSCKLLLGAGGWWLKPITLAIQEAKIRRTIVHSQPRQIVCKTLK
jgi:hypothetical protein